MERDNSYLLIDIDRVPICRLALGLLPHFQVQTGGSSRSSSMTSVPSDIVSPARKRSIWKIFDFHISCIFRSVNAADKI